LTEETISKEQFQGWFDDLKNKKLPKKCSLNQARALLVLAFYSGLMSYQITDLRPEHLTKIKVDGHKFIKISFKSKKKWKNVLMPFNKHTRVCFDFVKSFPEGMRSFYSFQSKTKAVAEWSKPILVRTVSADGSVSESREVIKESKPFIRRGNLISLYIKLWTGKSFSSLRSDFKLRVNAKKCA